MIETERGFSSRKIDRDLWHASPTMRVSLPRLATLRDSGYFSYTEQTREEQKRKKEKKRWKKRDRASFSSVVSFRIFNWQKLATAIDERVKSLSTRSTGRPTLLSCKSGRSITPTAYLYCIVTQPSNTFDSYTNFIFFANARRFLKSKTRNQTWTKFSATKFPSNWAYKNIQRVAWYSINTLTLINTWMFKPAIEIKFKFSKKFCSELFLYITYKRVSVSVELLEKEAPRNEKISWKL